MEKRERGDRRREVRSGRKGGKGGEAKKGIYKIAFWNVAGLGNKDREFWEGLKEWEVILMSETWVDKKGWERVKERLPKGYSWEAQWARRVSKKGRTMGGMMMGVKKKFRVDRGESIREMERVMVRKLCFGGEWWRVVGVYVKKDLETKLQAIREWMEEKKRG